MLKCPCSIILRGVCWLDMRQIIMYCLLCVCGRCTPNLNKKTCSEIVQSNTLFYNDLGGEGSWSFVTSEPIPGSTPREISPKIMSQKCWRPPKEAKHHEFWSQERRLHKTCDKSRETLNEMEPTDPVWRRDGFSVLIEALGVDPDVVVGVGLLLSQRLLEPLVLVAGVVGDVVHNDLDTW